MRLRRAWWNATLLVALALPLAACGDDDGPVDGTDSGLPDAGPGPTDGGSDPVDAGDVADAGHDAGTTDAGSDGGGDAGMTAEAPVVTAADPTDVAQGSSLTLTGERLGDATSVTIGGIAQVIGASTATTLTIDAVDATTPTGAQPVVVTSDAGASAPHQVTVLAPLALVSASGATDTSVVLVFSRALDPATVDAAAFTIAGLTVSDASASGANVTLTTSAQTPTADYTVLADASITDSFGNALTGHDEASFVGFEPAVPVVTMLSAMHVVPGASSLTLTGSDLTGATVTIGGAAQTITSQSDTEIVIDPVSASTALGTQPVVASRAGLDSAAIDVEVVEPFRIVSAAATSATTVEVEFNRDVQAPVEAARFTISGGLAVSAASVTGDTVTLTTAAQTPGETYTVSADAMLLDTLGIPVTADATAFTGFIPTEFVIDAFTSVVAADHPDSAGAYSTWYDVTQDAYATAASGTLGGAPALRIGDGGFTNGVYTIYENAIPVDGTYRISVPVHVVENAMVPNGIRGYQVGVAVGASAVHRPAGSPSRVAPLTISASYTGLTTTADDTAVGPQTLVTIEFSAQAGDDLLIAFGTDVTTGLWNADSNNWGTAPDVAYVLVGPITLLRSP